MLGIGAAAVRDEMAADAAAIGVEQIEARIGRGLGEIGDGDDLDILDRGAVPVEGGAGAGDHARIQDRIDADARLRGQGGWASGQERSSLPGT